MPAANHEAIDRSGMIAGVSAYGLWGLFPLVFHQLSDVSAFEVLMHRIAWSFVAVLLLIRWRGPRGWVGPLRHDRRQIGRLVAASLLVATNWLVYVWAVNDDRVVEAALGYYINPLITVALGVALLGEQLRRAQVVAIGLGLAAVVVLTVAYGRLPWVSLVLAFSFAGYGFQKKFVTIGAAPSLAVETAVLAPLAVVSLVVMEATGHADFGHGPAWRTALLAALGVITAGPLLLFAAAARRIPLSMLGLLQYLTPTGQLLCGVVVLGEDLPPERLAGFVLVWCALVVLGTDAVRASRRGALPVPEPV